MHSTVHLQMELSNIKVRHKYACWPFSMRMAACCDYTLRGAVSGISLLALCNEQAHGPGLADCSDRPLKKFSGNLNAQTCYLG